VRDDRPGDGAAARPGARARRGDPARARHRAPDGGAGALLRPGGGDARRGRVRRRRGDRCRPRLVVRPRDEPPPVDEFALARPARGAGGADAPRRAPGPRCGGAFGMRKIALLALEDGTTYRGEAFGADGETYGEVVFNTAITGYQEVLTDPSYRGQIVAMTAPEIGNVGTNGEDEEAPRPVCAGFVVRELAPAASSWRAERSLDAYLVERGIVGIAGIDTRALTRRLRTAGAQRGAISTTTLDPAELVERVRRSPGMEGRDLVREVTCAATFTWDE